MKSLSWVVLLSSLVCLPSAGFASDPPAEELMTEVPETGLETRLGITEEELLVSDVAVFPADPGEEDPEIALTYWAARDHIAQGNWSHARCLLEEGLEKFPQSRHLHQQLAELLWYEYNDVSQEPETLAAAASHVVRAERLAMGAGRSDPALHELAAKLLGRRGDVAAIDEVFAAVVEMDDSAASHASYAEALALAGDDRAASMYQAASERAPGDPELRIRLAEWHLLRGQFRQGLAELNRRPRVDVPYSWFLRGYANEKMGRSRRALDRYQRFMPANEAYPGGGLDRAQSRPARIGAVEQWKLPGGVQRWFDARRPLCLRHVPEQPLRRHVSGLVLESVDHELLEQQYDLRRGERHLQRLCAGGPGRRTLSGRVPDLGRLQLVDHPLS